jgi:hypothetical protein
VRDSDSSLLLTINPSAPTHMQVITPGHKYFLANLENPDKGQVIQFIEKTVEQPSIISSRKQEPKFVTVNDGTTNEEVLAMLFDRLEALNAKVPNGYTFLAAHHVSLALNVLQQRTAERQARGVEGTPKP